jgi:hypothetical protein
MPALTDGQKQSLKLIAEEIVSKVTGKTTK